MSKENQTIEVNGKTLELIPSGGGCCTCYLKRVGINNFAFGKVAECVKITNGICVKSMGSYFKLKKETK